MPILSQSKWSRLYSYLDSFYRVLESEEDRREKIIQARRTLSQN